MAYNMMYNSCYGTVKPETLTVKTLTNLANWDQILKLQPFKVKPPSIISAFK